MRIKRPGLSAVIVALAILISTLSLGFEANAAKSQKSTKEKKVGTVKDLKEVSWKAGESVTFSWTKDPLAAGYKVQALIDDVPIEGFTKFVDIGDKASYKVKTTALGKRITFRVLAYDKDKNPAEYVAYIKGITAPATPNNISLKSWKPGKATSIVKFTGYDADNSDYHPDGYQIKYTTLKGKRIRVVNISNAFVWESEQSLNKAKNAGFKFQIRSYVKFSSGKLGYSRWSKPVAFVPYAQVTGLRGQYTKTVSWNKVANAKSYTVCRSTDGGTTWKKVKTVSAKTRTAKVKGFGGYGSTNLVKIVANVKIGKETFKSSKQEEIVGSFNYVLNN